MKRAKRKIDFKDARGTIMDIFVSEPYEHCVIIYSNKGAVRGSHYHKNSVQADFMLSGRMMAYSRKKGSKKIEKFVVSTNDVTHWEKGEAHEFIALGKCAFISFVNGPRGGDKYETDTYRLKIPLHEQLKLGITDWTLMQPGKFHQEVIKKKEANMPSIAVIGANGYVGSAVSKELKKSHTVTDVTRENYEAMKNQAYDIVINSAMPSGRFWAKSHPEEDYIETVKKTADLVNGWRFKKFIQISTVSARCQLDTVYGKNKAEAEKLVNHDNNLIVRLGALYSQDMKKGVLVDMLKGSKVFVDGRSRYSFISLGFVASWIADNLGRTGIIELGGKNAIALKEIAGHIRAHVEFEGALNHQDITGEEPGLPEAAEVLAFMDKMKK